MITKEDILNAKNALVEWYVYRQKNPQVNIGDSDTILIKALVAIVSKGTELDDEQVMEIVLADSIARHYF